MTELENPPSSRASASASGSCGGRISRLVWILLLAVLLGSLGYAAYMRYPRQGLLVPVTQVSPKLVALEQRLDMLEAQLSKVLPPGGDLTPPNEEVKKPKTPAENKEAQDQQTTQKLIASAFAYWDLREAAKTGHSFAPQLAALRAATVNSPATSDLITRLEPYALEGALTLPQLREALRAEERTAPLPVAENAPTSFGARVKTALQPFVSIRPLRDERFANLEKAFDSGSAPAALEAVKALPENLQQHLALWRAKLEARIAVDDAFLVLSARIITPPSQRSAP
jgi:hypothetical protein